VHSSPFKIRSSKTEKAAIPAHREHSVAPDASERFLLFGALSVKLFPVLLLPFAQDCGNRLLTVEKFRLDSYAVKLKA